MDNLLRVINRDCNYIDFLGEKRIGKIVYAEVYNDAILCYIKDTLNLSYNDKVEIKDNKEIAFSDIRDITEIELC